ncbi:hypothetical protein WR25_03129 [Diploscapter pachys]|uniref:Uncharacterized protein n=1 Tax=Diploscapter pachys TaxID=2018661 RepID=A0A2A2KEP5_9BILA|nr:hypothetical protein WR25_03129 [Diploscapter pachys]
MALGLALRRLVGTAEHRVGTGVGQPLAVELAIGRQRHGRQCHTMQFHLEIVAAKELQLAIGATTHQVAAAIQALIDHERAGTETRVLAIGRPIGGAPSGTGCRGSRVQTLQSTVASVGP